MKNEKIIYLILFISVIITLISLIIYNSFYWYQNLLNSIDYIIYIQDKLGVPFFNYFNFFLSNILFYAIFGLSIIFFYFEKKETRSYSLLFTLCIGLFFQGFLKLLFLEPRPIYINNNIKLIYSLECNYGNPSGHSYLSTLLLFTFFNLFKIKNLLYKFLFLLILILIDFGIIYSRIYLGLHTIFQVLFGFLFGIFFYLFIYFTKKIWLNLILKPIIQNKEKKLKEFIIFNIFMFVLNFATIFTFFYVRDKVEPNLINKNNFILNQHCSNLFLNSRDRTFSYKHLKEMMIFNIFFGIIFGVYFNKGIKVNDININPQKKSFSFLLIRFLLYSSSFILTILYYLNFKNEPIIVTIIRYILLCFLSGFFTGFIIPKLKLHWKLIYKQKEKIDEKNKIKPNINEEILLKKISN